MMVPMTMIETATPLTVDQILAAAPGARLIDGFEIPDDLDAVFPTPYGDNPPAEWLLTPHHDVLPGTSGLITADGRFCAYSHEWDRCHNSYTADGTCWTPPRSPTGLRYYHQATIVTAEGVQLPIGVIPLGDGHASPDVDLWTAMRHYDRPDRVVVRARAVETDDGCVLCGALVPGVTNRQVAIMRASALSGDWRYVPEIGAMEYLGSCFVARPGLPIGIEVAAIEQQLWEIERAFVTTTAADGSVRSATGRVASWVPRSPVTDQLQPTVIAAATGGTLTMPVTHPGSTQPGPQAASHTCSCQTQAPATSPVEPVTQAQALPEPEVRTRQAAAGTALSYRELDEQVRTAVSAAFEIGEHDYVWVKDWDDTWAVFELETSNPISGASYLDYRVPIQIDTEGMVTVDKAQVVEVETVFVPVDPAPMATPSPVAAHASEATAIAAMSERMETIEGTVAAIAADVAKLVTDDAGADEIADELPEPPETS